ncbi:hypothetical protein DL93DRAFT_2071412 [Clavulina sp. PMI_390]|nr:hypothetical protein DL93DRAFT_2071412 [Clavulina sp. PMI_390]
MMGMLMALIPIFPLCFPLLWFLNSSPVDRLLFLVCIMYYAPYSPGTSACIICPYNHHTVYSFQL